MTTVSYDLRISARANSVLLEYLNFSRTIELEILRSIESVDFNRTVENNIIQSVEDVSFFRTIERRILGSLENVSFNRTVENRIFIDNYYSSDQFRNISFLFASTESFRSIVRNLSYIYNPKLPYIYDARIAAYAKTYKTGESFSVILENEGIDSARNFLQKIENQSNVIQQIDSVANFNWTGTFDENSRFGVGFSVNGGAIQAIDLGLPITTDSTPVLSWEATYNPEATQTIEYRVQVAKDVRMKYPLYDIRTSGLSYTIPSALTEGTYYWRVKSYDKLGSEYLDESDWSNIFEFEYKASIINTIPDEFNITWDSSFLLPSGQLNYIFNTKNLLSKDQNGDYYTYRFYVIFYQFNSTRDAVSTPIPSSSSLSFNVDHRSANSPVFTTINYDEQTHCVAINARIEDSLGRIYRLKDFYYLDRSDPNNSWERIDDYRILGQIDGLNSRPSLHNRGMISWGASADADIAYGQDLTYNVRLLSTPEHRDNDFYYYIEYINDSELIDILSISPASFGTWYGTYYDIQDIPSVCFENEFDKDINIYPCGFLNTSLDSQIAIYKDNIADALIINVGDDIKNYEVLRGFEPSSIEEGNFLSSEFFTHNNYASLSLRESIHTLLPNIIDGQIIHVEVVFLDALGSPVVRYNTVLDKDKYFYREYTTDKIAIGNDGIAWNRVYGNLYVNIPISLAGNESVNYTLRICLFGDGSSLDPSMSWIKMGNGELLGESIQNKIIRINPYKDTIINQIQSDGTNNYKMRWRNSSSDDYSEEYEYILYSKAVEAPAPKLWYSPSFYVNGDLEQTTECYINTTLETNLGQVFTSHNMDDYAKFQVYNDNKVWEDIPEEVFNLDAINNKYIRLVLDTTDPTISADIYGSINSMECLIVDDLTSDFFECAMVGNSTCGEFSEQNQFYSIDTEIIDYSDYSNYQLTNKNNLLDLNSNNIDNISSIIIDFKNTYYIEYLNIEFSKNPSGYLKVYCYKNDDTTDDYTYNSVSQLAKFVFKTNYKKIKLEIFSTCRYIISNITTKTYGLSPSSDTINRSYLKFVNTEETDIVSDNLLINLEEYYDYCGLPYPWLAGAGLIDGGNGVWDVGSWDNMQLDTESIMPEGVDEVLVTRYGFSYRFRVMLFKDIGAKNLLYSKISNASSDLELTNLELFENGITNIILDIKNIKNTFYELTYNNIQQIETKIGDSDYWIACRSKDHWISNSGREDLEYSRWSNFALWKNSNIYTIFWNISGMDIEPSSDIMFKCRAVLSVPNEGSDIPIFGFEPKSNVLVKEVEAREIALTALQAQNNAKSLEIAEIINGALLEDTFTIEF